MMETRSTLLRRVRDPADADGWREFVALYEPLLLAYVQSKGAKGHDADDLVQEVLARLVKELPRFELKREQGRFRTWLWRLTCNALVDWARRRRRQVIAEQAWAAGGGADLPGVCGPAEDREPEADWVRWHRRRVLEHAQAQVRARAHPRTWACFEGHVLRGRTAAEIAAELGVSPNVVAVNSSRVLARLRSYCRDYLEDLADGDEPLPD
jgi:RNA polymerase sigma factor (sigma-70 family)